MPVLLQYYSEFIYIYLGILIFGQVIRIKITQAQEYASLT